MSRRRLRSGTVYGISPGGRSGGGRGNGGRTQSVSLHLVTPEEPTLGCSEPCYCTVAEGETTFTEGGEQRSETVRDGQVEHLHTHHRHGAAKESFAVPSTESTKDLEISIISLLNEIKQVQTNSVVLDKFKLIHVLNRSLLTISHWSLQAQLSELKSLNCMSERDLAMIKKDSDDDVEEGASSPLETPILANYTTSISQNSSPERGRGKIKYTRVVKPSRSTRAKRIGDNFTTPKNQIVAHQDTIPKTSAAAAAATTTTTTTAVKRSRAIRK